MTDETHPAEDPILVFETAMRTLRKPFPDEQIGLLPRAVRKGDENRMRCEPSIGRAVSIDGKYCGGYHPQSVHLSYVGHAALTARLLDADPRWGWEPVAWGSDGLPAFDRNGGLWIRLTVAGVTRLGYGDAQGKSGGNAIKEAIGDALRNGGMRFGAALDLWSKEDLRAADEERGTEGNPSGHPSGSPQANAGSPAPTPQGGGPSPETGAQGIPEEIRSQWRVHVLSREYLGNDPSKGQPKDGGLRSAYHDAKEAGVLRFSIAPNDETTFVQLFQRLSAELPERPDESKDTPPADESEAERNERITAEAEREARNTPMALEPSGWGTEGEQTGGAWTR